MKYFSTLILVLIFTFLTFTTQAGIWKIDSLDSYVLPEEADITEIEKIILTYKSYMQAFSDENFHRMTDYLNIGSAALSWENYRDAIDDYSLIKMHILDNYSHTNHLFITLMTKSPDRYVLNLNREHIDTDGDVLHKAVTSYAFIKVDGVWKIDSMKSKPPMRRPF